MQGKGWGALPVVGGAVPSRFSHVFPPALYTSEHNSVFGRQYFCSESGNPLISSDSGCLGSNNHIQTLHDFCLFK